jgi:predicted nucleic acid-binding protein
MVHSFGLIAVLDACVLYPAPLRDLLLHFANFNFYQPRWSDEIQTEWIRNLLQNRPDLNKRQLNSTVALMNNSFPNANVVRYEYLIPSLTLPDANDRHVLAAAIHSQASFIVTFNLKDFPTSRVKRHDIEVLHPDLFVMNLIDLNPDLSFGAFKYQVSCLKNPSFSEEEVLGSLERCGLVKSVARLAKML